MDLIQITPIDKITSYKVNSFRIFVNELILNKSAKLIINFYDNSFNVNGYSECKYIMGETLLLEGEDYQKWQSDDYIYDYVCKKFSLNKLNNTNVNNNINNVVNINNNVNDINNILYVTGNTFDVSNNATYITNVVDISNNITYVRNAIVLSNNVVTDLSKNNVVLEPNKQ